MLRFKAGQSFGTTENLKTFSCLTSFKVIKLKFMVMILPLIHQSLLYKEKMGKGKLHIKLKTLNLEAYSLLLNCN